MLFRSTQPPPWGGVKYITMATATEISSAQPKAPLGGDGGAAIFVTEKAAEKVRLLMQEAGVENDPSYFLRVGVVGGGCTGLSYKMDFDNELQPTDQQFEDNGIKIVCDLKSFLYLVNTTLEFSDGLNGKGFQFMNPNASRTCGCGESFSV